MRMWRVLCAASLLALSTALTAQRRVSGARPLELNDHVARHIEQCTSTTDTSKSTSADGTCADDYIDPGIADELARSFGSDLADEMKEAIHDLNMVLCACGFSVDNAPGGIIEKGDRAARGYYIQTVSTLLDGKGAVCESGFGAGYGALFSLVLNLKVHVYVFSTYNSDFDMADVYDQEAVEYLQSRYTDDEGNPRLHFIHGDSTKTLPAFIAAGGEKGTISLDGHSSEEERAAYDAGVAFADSYCGFVMIDGGRNYEIAKADTIHFRMLARDGVVVLQHDNPLRYNPMTGIYFAWSELIYIHDDLHGCIDAAGVACHDSSTGEIYMNKAGGVSCAVYSMKNVCAVEPLSLPARMPVEIYYEPIKGITDVIKGFQYDRYKDKFDIRFFPFLKSGAFGVEGNVFLPKCSDYSEQCKENLLHVCAIQQLVRALSMDTISCLLGSLKDGRDLGEIGNCGPASLVDCVNDGLKDYKKLHFYIERSATVRDWVVERSGGKLEPEETSKKVHIFYFDGVTASYPLLTLDKPLNQTLDDLLAKTSTPLRAQSPPWLR